MLIENQQDVHLAAVAQGHGLAVDQDAAVGGVDAQAALVALFLGAEAADSGGKDVAENAPVGIQQAQAGQLLLAVDVDGMRLGQADQAVALVGPQDAPDFVGRRQRRVGPVFSGQLAGQRGRAVEVAAQLQPAQHVAQQPWIGPGQAQQLLLGAPVEGAAGGEGVPQVAEAGAVVNADGGVGKDVTEVADEVGVRLARAGVGVVGAGVVAQPAEWPPGGDDQVDAVANVVPFATKAAQAVEHLRLQVAVDAVEVGQHQQRALQRLLDDDLEGALEGAHRLVGVGGRALVPLSQQGGQFAPGFAIAGQRGGFACGQQQPPGEGQPQRLVAGGDGPAVDADGQGAEAEALLALAAVGGHELAGQVPLAAAGQADQMDSAGALQTAQQLVPQRVNEEGQGIAGSGVVNEDVEIVVGAVGAVDVDEAQLGAAAEGQPGVAAFAIGQGGRPVEVAHVAAIAAGFVNPEAAVAEDDAEVLFGDAKQGVGGQGEPALEVGAAERLGLVGHGGDGQDVGSIAIADRQLQIRYGHCATPTRRWRKYTPVACRVGW